VKVEESQGELFQEMNEEPVPSVGVCCTVAALFDGRCKKEDDCVMRLLEENNKDSPSLQIIAKARREASLIC
jgi:hypothetical protein